MFKVLWNWINRLRGRHLPGWINQFSKVESFSPLNRCLISQCRSDLVMRLSDAPELNVVYATTPLRCSVRVFVALLQFVISKIRQIFPKRSCWNVFWAYFQQGQDSRVRWWVKWILTRFPYLKGPSQMNLPAESLWVSADFPERVATCSQFSAKIINPLKIMPFSYI